MSEMKHTRGPWSACFERTHEKWVITAPDEDGSPVEVCQDRSWGEGYEEEDEANARLIAAAPDYHEATDWILDAVTSNAAPVNPMSALEEMALSGLHITLDAGLVLDLLTAHSKATGGQP